VSKWSAALLLLLILLPFTPPFSTCGLSDLTGEAAADHAPAPAAKDSQELATADANPWIAVPLFQGLVAFDLTFEDHHIPLEIRPAPLRL
jgi:hypothetical protein